MGAHITNLQREVVPEGVLDTQAVVDDVRGLKIRVHRQETALAWIRTSAVAALDATRRAAGKHHMIPIEIGGRRIGSSERDIAVAGGGNAIHHKLCSSRV